MNKNVCREFKCTRHDSIMATIAAMATNVLTEVEKTWCAQIREAAMKENIPYDSDFSLAQFAIVTKGSIPKALKRMKKQNAYKDVRKYSIKEAAEKMAKMMPNSTMCCGRDVEGRIVVFFRADTFKSSLYQHPEFFDLMYAYLTDILSSMTSNLEDIRRGATFLLDMKNMGWGNFSSEMEKRMAQLYQDNYPIKLKKILFIDPPWIISMIMGIASLFIKQKLRDRIVKSWRVGEGKDHFSAHVTPANLPKLYFEHGAFDGEKKPVHEWVQSCLDEKQKNIDSLKL